MFPKTQPLPVGLRPGTRFNGDPLHAAWSHLAAARQVPYVSNEPARWLRGFNASARAALEAFNQHCAEAEASDSCLSLNESDGNLGARIRSQRDDHVRLHGRLEALVALSCRQERNTLGQLILTNEAAALIQLFLGLHHRRLGDLLRDAGLMPPEVKTLAKGGAR